MRVVIIGGSVAGLTAGLALSRQGHQVTILERDAQALPGSPAEAATSWRRGGIPQVRQGHAFISRARAEFLEHAPDVWGAFLDAGAVELPLTGQRRSTLDGYTELPADSEHAFLFCRRTTFEWVLRRAAEPECDLRLGTKVEGLLTDTSAARPRVTGVWTSAGPLAAELVIDASGRSGGLAQRVRDAGGTIAPVEDEPCGLVYATRFYRLRDGAGWGPLNRVWAAGGAYDGYSSAIFPADNNTFSVGFGRLPSDDELRPAQTTDGFARAVARVPFVSEWVDPERCEPLGPAVPMAGIHNMLTRTSGIDAFVAMGDGVCTTDPSYGRGAAVAIASAFAFAGFLGASAADVVVAAEQFDAWFDAEVVPWHADAVATDRGRTAKWERTVAASRAGAAGEEPQRAPRPAPLTDAALPPVPPPLVAAAGLSGPDPEVWRAFVAYAGMLSSPTALMTADIIDRVRRMTAAGWAPPELGAPSHREMVEAVSSFS